MYLIVGLGNPGKNYYLTRHNVGYLTIDAIADRLGIEVRKSKFEGVYGDTTYKGKKLILLKPETYMNLSGRSVKKAIEFYKIEPSNLIIIYDDVDTKAYNLRLRAKGSAGTHNGMKSIIYELGYDNFPRVRLGIGKPPVNMDLSSYVLCKYPQSEIDDLKEMLYDAAQAALSIVDEGIDVAMNKHNPKRTEEARVDE